MAQSDGKRELTTMLDNDAKFLDQVAEFSHRMTETAHPEDAHEAASIQRVAAFYAQAKRALIAQLNSQMEA